MVNFVDRVPTYPGRVTLSPVSGQANTYDLTRADNPTVAGTPVNAALFAAIQAEIPQIAYGTYTGDGAKTKTYNFDFEPQFFMVMGTDTGSNSSRGYLLLANKASDYSQYWQVNNDNNAYFQSITWGTNSITIPTTSQTYQLPNSSGCGYAYLAIGMPN